jgi:hypothetical protein
VWNPCLAEFKAQAFLIGALQQPWPEVPMHLNGKAYNLSGRIGTSIVVHETFVIFVSLWCIFF